MIKFKKDFASGKKLRFRKLHIMRRLKRGKLCPGIILITEPSNPANKYDMFDARELIFPYNKERDIMVYGMAANREEANELLLRLLEEDYANT